MEQWRKEIERIRQATGLAIQIESCPQALWEKERSSFEDKGGEILLHSALQGGVWYIGIQRAEWSQEARALLSLLLSAPKERTITEQATEWLSAALQERIGPIPASVEAGWQWREPRGCFLLERIHADRSVELEQWQQLLQNFLPSSPAPMLLPLSSACLLLLVPHSALPDVETGQENAQELWINWAYTLHELLLSETMEMIRVAVSLPAESPGQLAAVVKSCTQALQSIKHYRPKEMVAGTWQYPLEQWAYSLGPTIRDTLLSSLGPNLALSEEQQEILHALFANQLNVSETARALFLHRNTLLYRIDKLKEKTGLDPREFSDAVFLRLAMLFRQNS